MKAVFVILAWQECHVEDISLAVNEAGKALVFGSHKEAQGYAEANLNFNWMIVEIED